MVSQASGEYANKVWVGTADGNEGEFGYPANWDPCGVVDDNDSVYFLNSSQNVTSGFDQNSINLSGLYIENSYTGYIGDSDEYLDINATTVEIGQYYGTGTTSGSGRIKLDLGTAQSTIIVYNSGTSYDSGLPAIRLLTNHASTTLEVRKGSVGLAYQTGETSTLGKVITSYVSQIGNDADVFIGSGVTLITLDLKGGQTYLGCAATTVNAYAGWLTTTGSGAITTVNAKGTTIYSNSTGTITTLNITGGIADFLRAAAARTVTTLKLDATGTLKYDPGVVTITNNIDSDNPVVLMAAKP